MYASAIALRQMLQRSRRRATGANEKARKILVTKSIARVMAESLVPVRQVFDHYATAELRRTETTIGLKPCCSRESSVS